MNFVNGDRGVEPILFFARGEPVAVAPGIIPQIRDNGAGFRAELRTERVWIGFEREESSGGPGDLVLVDRAFAEAGKKEFPNSRRAARAHGMDASVPSVEIADDADASCRRRPDSEINSGNSIDGLRVRAEFFVGIVVAAFGHKVQVEITELKREGIRVVEFERNAFVRAALNFVAAGFGCGSLARWPCRFEKPLGAQFYRVGDFRGIAERKICLVGPRNEESNGPTVFNGMWT